MSSLFHTAITLETLFDGDGAIEDKRVTFAHCVHSMKVAIDVSVYRRRDDATSDRRKGLYRLELDETTRQLNMLELSWGAGHSSLLDHGDAPSCTRTRLYQYSSVDYIV